MPSPAAESSKCAGRLMFQAPAEQRKHLKERVRNSKNPLFIIAVLSISLAFSLAAVFYFKTRAQCVSADMDTEPLTIPPGALKKPCARR